ncbi:DUF116 domain-containing protein [Effusibacillus lacus]|uniref:DUF116 domain-containing protein n=1 Tax=Effusibacillus lacus TaxID=1348429 RepID=A0A292YK56_9BACL|nr:DUF116 domain-containing protein [Effusibacillus lacus]TCS72026.1 hypothetical protein EDD64_12320 [Effusibacillus lacus]GAX90318.1 hypothetical protein EFBL_1944 [Effusibacillus lacus]
MSNIDSATNAVEQAAPRKLGDTWEGWAGEIEENSGDLATSPWYFLSFYTVALLVLHGMAWFLWFLGEPRLAQIGLWLKNTVLIGGVTALTVMDLGLLLIVATVLTGKNFVPHYKGKHIALSPLLPMIVKIGGRMGLSKDRISNSLLQVGNRITAANVKQIQSRELLILLPRCLTKVMRDSINEIAARYNVVAHVCGGGQQARQLLAEKKPKGVIAVACERDLMAGVQDVGAAIPVIAIANKRPEGPCRNTHIDLLEMENAFRTFLGND